MKIWLPIHSRNFGSHVTVRPPAHPSVRLHHPKTRVKCTLIAVKTGYLETDDQYHMTLSRAQVSTYRG